MQNHNHNNTEVAKSRRSLNINIHTNEYSTFADKEEEYINNTITDDVYETIRKKVIDENKKDIDMVTSVILSLITKHTHTMTHEAVMQYKKDNNQGIDKDITKDLDNIVDALNEISQIILGEKIGYNRLNIKVRRHERKQAEK